MEETRIYADDLTESGSLIMVLFKTVYPDGLTIEQMEQSGIGWLERAARRLREVRN